MKINSFTYFFPEKPGLIHLDQPLFSRLSDDRAWIAEPKFNGKRLELHRLPSGKFLYFNRHGEPMAYTPTPELVRELEAFNLSGYWLFDGELRDRKVKGVRDKITLYDVFIAEGELLTGATFADRRGILETLFHYSGPYTDTLTLADQYPGDFRAVYDLLTVSPEIEGLVMKNLGGKLDLGRNRAANSAWMMKVRRPSNSYKF